MVAHVLKLLLTVEVHSLLFFFGSSRAERISLSFCSSQKEMGDESLKGEQAVHSLLVKIMSDRFCRVEANDFDACIANFVPQHIDGSFVDQALQRKGLKKCEPYKLAAQKCIQDDKKQSAILKKAAQAPNCKEERAILQKCQRQTGGANGACEAEALEMMICGLVPMVKKLQRQSAKSAEE